MLLPVWLLIVLAFLWFSSVTVVFWSGVKKKKMPRSPQDLLEKQLLTHKLNIAELNNLKQKVNPHLFKNILNSIQSHAYQTYFALDKLSSVLDFILYESDEQYVTLEEEIKFALNFIEINRLKLSPLFDIRVKNQVDPKSTYCAQKIMAPLITINLIENAFKHADLQSADAFISIVFDLEGSEFSLIVVNKINLQPGMIKQNSGLGLDTLRRRLDLLYGENYRLNTLAEKQVYKAHLKINLDGIKIKVPASG